MLVRLLLAALGAGSIFPAWARADDSPSFKAGVAAKASYITPVPGGVGPVCHSILLRNIAACARKSAGPAG